MIGASRWWTVTSSQSPTWATASDVVVVAVGAHHVVEIVAVSTLRGPTVTEVVGSTSDRGR
jgi:hypothetical protein